MEALFISTGVIALAEIGDKTQLLAFILAARFKKPLTWPDTIAITARIPTVEADRFTLEHVIYSEHWSGIATEGSGLIVTFDYTANKKVPVPDELRALIEKGSIKIFFKILAVLGLLPRFFNGWVLLKLLIEASVFE